MIEEKRKLRQEMRTLRRNFTDRSVSDSRITEQFLKSEIYRNTDTLLFYASFDGEADTFGLIEQALSDGKAVYLPRCVKGSNQMDFYRILSSSELAADAFGILAPKEDAERLFTGGNRAVCAVPGLAFTKRGERLGYGRGYYDTFLEKIDVCTVGLCYAFQVIDAVPTEAHDKRMQFLCTEQGLQRCIRD